MERDIYEAVDNADRETRRRSLSNLADAVVTYRTELHQRGLYGEFADSLVRDYQDHVFQTIRDAVEREAESR